MASNPTPEQEIQALKEEVRILTAKLDQLKKARNELEETRLRLDEKRFALEEQKHQAEIEKSEREAEKDQVELDRARHDLEEKKYLFDEKKNADKHPILSSLARNAALISVLVPLLIAAGTLAYNAYSANQLTKNEFRQKTAEVLLNSTSPKEAKAKLEAVATIFPGSADATALVSFDANMYSRPNPQSQKELINLVVDHPERKEEIVSLWMTVFPGDEWAKNIKTDETTASTPSPASQPNAPTPTPRQTNTPTPAEKAEGNVEAAAPTCQVVVVPPGGGNSGGTWGQIADLFHDNPGLAAELYEQDEGFRKFLNQLAQDPLILDQLNLVPDDDTELDNQIFGPITNPTVEVPEQPLQ